MASAAVFSDELDPGQIFRSLHELKPDVILFDQCDPCDLRQGHIGDCWLIAALATACEYPEFVQSLITDQGDRTYKVKLFSYEKKEFVTLTFDDSVPWAGLGYAEPTKYAHLSHAGECWPCILEKGFATITGGYANIRGGSSCHAFGVLTGCQDLEYLLRRESGWVPARYGSNFDNPKEVKGWMSITGAAMSVQSLAAKLTEYADSGYLMCCGSNSHEDGDDHVSHSGIVSGHAYTVLQVVQDPGTEWGLTLIRLRNPWGRDGEWLGDWSDNSSKWDEFPHVSDAVDHISGNNGLFWMCIEDFVKEYRNVSICKFSPAGLGLTMPRLRRDVKKKHLPPNPICCFRKNEMSYYIHSGNKNLKYMEWWGWTFESSPFNAWPSATQEETVEIHCFRRVENAHLCHTDWSGYAQMGGWGWKHESVAFYAYPPETTSTVYTVNPPESMRAYSSVYNSDPAGKGHCRSMLDSSQAWSAATSKVGQWMQLDLGTIKSVVGTVVQGRHDMVQRVTKYMVHASRDCFTWEEIPGVNITCDDRDVKQRHLFENPVEARMVRIYVLEWEVYASMRAAVLVQDEVQQVHEFCKGDRRYYLKKDHSFYDRMKEWGWAYSRVAFAVPPATLENSAINTFKTWDNNGDGVITCQELGSVFKALDPDKWDDEKINCLIQKADTSGDGVLQYEEFVKWILSSGALV